jgi:hypothetical protein
MEMICAKCGERSDRLAVLALLKTMNVFVSGPVEKCLGGEEHDFVSAARKTTLEKPEPRHEPS